MLETCSGVSVGTTFRYILKKIIESAQLQGFRFVQNVSFGAEGGKKSKLGPKNMTLCACNRDWCFDGRISLLRSGEGCDIVSKIKTGWFPECQKIQEEKGDEKCKDRV